MTNEKAREFFSPYYEGTLESGLKLSFERFLHSDPELQREYRLFERTLEELGELKFDEIEVPHDLHEKISAAIDRHIYENKRAATTGLSAFWRALALGGLAFAAIAGTVYSLPHTGGKVVPAGPGFGPVDAPKASGHLEFKADPKSVAMEIEPAADQSITIASAPDGRVLRRVVVRAGQLNVTPLVNDQPTPAALSVSMDAEAAKVVVLPGTERGSDRSGEGDLMAFAKALAGYYNVPVVLDVKDVRQIVRWSFNSASAVEAAGQALTRLSVDQRDKLVTISDH